MAPPGSAPAGVALLSCAYIAMLEDRHADAANLGREAIESALRRRDLLSTAYAMIATAWPLAEQGELERSARLLGSAVGFLESAGAERQWMDKAYETAVCKILREQLDAPTVQALLDEGRKTSLEDGAFNESSALAAARE